ncbi:hypothetical protein SAZ11_02050 [Streptomyces sp. FXJ1.4098]|nr:hypothetical protein [Streptomyces sp. FXJ1.4098]
MTGHQGRAGGSRPDARVGACARAGVFAALGTVLATFGHHAIAEGTVPWRMVGGLAAAQFAGVWPLARRHCPPTVTMLFTLATQGVLHLALSWADGNTPTGTPGHAAHAGHLTAAPGDGHAWHHAGPTMMTVHALAALAVAWLLHRADARMVAALEMLRTLATAALAHALPRRLVTGAEWPLGLPGRQAWDCDDLPAPADGDHRRAERPRRGLGRRHRLSDRPQPAVVVSSAATARDVLIERADDFGRGRRQTRP